MEKINIYIEEEINDFLKEKGVLKDFELESKVQKILTNCIKNESLEKYNISLAITTANKEEIRKLNNEYRNVDSVTDVLSFPIFSREEIMELKNNNSFVILPEINLGDVVLCLDKVYEQSIEFGTGIKRELLYMITHSVCHLLGYDHILEEDKKVMRSLEEEILSKIEV